MDADADADAEFWQRVRTPGKVEGGEDEEKGRK